MLGWILQNYSKQVRKLEEQEGVDCLELSDGFV